MYFSFCKTEDFSKEEISNAYNLLNQSEKEYINRITDDKKKQALAARALLCSMLSKHYPEISLTNLYKKENGSPYLLNYNIYVSLTHSEHYVGCALSENKVGIDIQKIKSVSEKLVSRVCSDSELSYIKNNNEKAFFTLWSAKEAYIKATEGAFSDITNKTFVNNNTPYFAEGMFKYGFIDDYAWSVIEI